jgi:hypothetical protein
MDRRAATYQDVIEAIQQQRLRVDVETGRVETRLPYPRARWRPAALEVVKGPHQTQGYHRVNFGSGLRCLVHRLVWFVARGPIPEGFEVNHKNGAKLSNGVDELELVTSSGNAAHRDANGLRVPARDRRAASHAKLSDEQVRAIRLDPRPQAVIGRAYGVSQGQVSHLLRGKTYAWVE